MIKARDTKDKIIKYIADKEDTSKTIMVGDTCYDVYGARANNIKTIGVLYGFGEEKEMLESKPDYIAQTVSDIYKFI